MKPRQIESHNFYKSSFGIVKGCEGQQQLWMGHEVCYPLQHTLWLQHKCRQSDSCKIHAGTKLRNHTQENVLVS